MLSLLVQWESGEDESDGEKGKGSPAQRDARLRKKKKLTGTEYVLPNGRTYHLRDGTSISARRGLHPLSQMSSPNPPRQPLQATHKRSNHLIHIPYLISHSPLQPNDTSPRTSRATKPFNTNTPTPEASNHPPWPFLKSLQWSSLSITASSLTLSLHSNLLKLAPHEKIWPTNGSRWPEICSFLAALGFFFFPPTMAPSQNASSPRSPLPSLDHDLPF